MPDRRLQFELDIDAASAQREARNIARIMEQELGRINTGGTRGGTAAAGRSPSMLQGMMGGIMGGLAGYFSVAGAQMLARQVMELDQMGAAYRRTQQGAEMMVGSQERLNMLLGEYSKMTGGAVTKMEAMQSIMEMTALGFADTTEEFNRFMRAVQGSAGATGRSAGYIQQQLMLTISNQSTMRLDQLGLSIEEVTARIEELKASTPGLTEKQAFQEAVLGRLNEKYGAMVDVAAANVTELQKLTVAYQNAIAEFAKRVQGEVNPVVGRMRYDFGARDLGATRSMLQLYEDTWIGMGKTARGLAELSNVLERYDAAVAAGIPANQSWVNEFINLTDKVRNGQIPAAQAADEIDRLNSHLMRLVVGAGDAASAVAALPGSLQEFYAKMGLKTGDGPTPTMMIGGKEQPLSAFGNQWAAYQRGQALDKEKEWYRDFYVTVTEGRNRDEARARDLYSQQRSNADAVEAAWKSAAQSVVDEFKGRLQNVPGLMGTSSVTGEQLDLAAQGVPQDFADNWLRRIEDEMLNSKDWGLGGREAASAALGRIGRDTSGIADAGVVALLRQSWDTSALFSNPENLELIDKAAVTENLRLQELAKQGQENIMAYFGLKDNPQAVERLQSYGLEAAGEFGAGIIQQMPTIASEAAQSLAANMSTIFTQQVGQYNWLGAITDAITAEVLALINDGQETADVSEGVQ